MSYRSADLERETGYDMSNHPVEVDGVTMLVPVKASRMRDLNRAEKWCGWDTQFLWKLAIAHTRRAYQQSSPITPHVAGRALPDDFRSGLSEIFDHAAYLSTVAVGKEFDLNLVRKKHGYDEEWQIFVDYAESYSPL